MQGDSEEIDLDVMDDGSALNEAQFTSSGVCESEESSSTANKNAYEPEAVHQELVMQQQEDLDQTQSQSFIQQDNRLQDQAVLLTCIASPITTSARQQGQSEDIGVHDIDISVSHDGIGCNAELDLDMEGTDIQQNVEGVNQDGIDRDTEIGMEMEFEMDRRSIQQQSMQKRNQDRDGDRDRDQKDDNSIGEESVSEPAPVSRALQLGGVFAWTKEDDERLKQIMKKYQANKCVWDAVAQEFGNGKSAKECFQRWALYIAPPRSNQQKRRFTVEEDAIIFHSVQSVQPKKPCWTKICKQLAALPNDDNSDQRNHTVGESHDPHRVRERWHNLLNPKLNKMPFTKAEDVRLYEGLREKGQKWTIISKSFFNETRSDIQLKNRFKTVSFQNFYAKVSARVLEQERRERLQGYGGSHHQQQAHSQAQMQLHLPTLDAQNVSLGTQQVLFYDDSNGSSVEPDQSSTASVADRVRTSLAAQVQGEDVPKPPPGKYFTPYGAAQILSRIGKSERRTVMRTWIDRKYVPVNLTSLYRILGRYNKGKKLKPRWYCEGRSTSHEGEAPMLRLEDRVVTEDANADREGTVHI